jgi:hypothetical protein
VFLAACHSVKRETREKHDKLNEKFSAGETIMPEQEIQDLTLLLRRWSESSKERWRDSQSWISAKCK